MQVHSNKLIEETSPYLLQHAHNPVDWYPWGEEALQRAKKEDKPILVSIGYAACHWCHVMERESFENEETAAIMNSHFINIKIDREERPDLDHIYMDAVQAMTGSGGWPLNVFLTPEGKPFYGGTYFPPVKVYNRPSWPDVLLSIKTAFSESRAEIDTQAENLTAHLLSSNSFGFRQPEDMIFDETMIEEAVTNVLKTADNEWGGFGKAPKFPQTFTIQFLLRHHVVSSGHTIGAQEELEAAQERDPGLKQALLSLDKMIDGGIYDQAGGGFARYSTDTEWLAPHFEKMLYDNALLVGLLSEAYQLTGKERYKEVIEETMDFIRRELLHEKHGFYSALDADSEGEEGKFYVWSLAEVRELLSQDTDVFCAYYDISEKGNWEGKNILRVKRLLEDIAEEHKLGTNELKKILRNGRKKLLLEREKRVRPLLDDKILLGWNAMMNTACSKAFAATGNEDFRRLAIANMEFLLENFRVGDTNEYFHTWKNNKAKYPAFLDDYACLIQALIQLQEITGETNWLVRAKELTEFVLDQFSEPETGFFFFTKGGQTDVIVRKKEVYDGAVPSGNAVMAYNLHHLSILFDRPEWRERSGKMVASLGQAVIRYPTSFGTWNCLVQEIVDGTREIAVMGSGYETILGEVLARYLPHRVLMGAEEEDESFPLIAGKKAGNPVLIYLCKDFSCLNPVDSTAALMGLIDSAKKGN
jgi:uncharacterized protein YyaL (SSP411 family)